MPYPKTTWQDGVTPLSAANLNKLETQYDKAVTWAKSFGLGDVALSISNTDVNLLDLTGFYRGSNLINAPNTGWFFIINIKHDSNFRTQLLFGYSNGGTAMYKRIQNDGIWGSWVTMETDAGAQAKADAVQANLIAHQANEVNPHGVTVAQINAVSEINAEYNTDPNTTQKGYILTNHANGPVPSAFFHIRSYFYSTKTGNRAQIAIRYNTQNDMYMRFYSGAWSSWQKFFHEGNIVGQIFGATEDQTKLVYTSATGITGYITLNATTYTTVWTSSFIRTETEIVAKKVKLAVIGACSGSCGDLYYWNVKVDGVVVLSGTYAGTAQYPEPILDFTNTPVGNSKTIVFEAKWTGSNDNRAKMNQYWEYVNDVINLYLL